MPELMNLRQKVAIVLPTLREAESLRILLPRVLAALAGVKIPFEILVVDDDSRDGTVEYARDAALADPRIRVVVRRGQQGLAGAILHGWDQTDATILGVMDADLQHPPELLPNLLAEILDGRDLAIGSRYAEGAGSVGWNPLRRLYSRIAVYATWPLQKAEIRVSDPLSGYFLVRRACVDGIVFRPHGFKLLLEILGRGRIRSIGEVPLAFGRRSAGKSKASLKVAWEYAHLLASLYAGRVGIGRESALRAMVRSLHRSSGTSKT